MVFIVILDHENMGIHTFFETLSCILLKILNKREFSVMAALICIYKIFPKVFRLTTPLDFVNIPM